MLKQYVSSPSSAGSDADIVAFALPRSEPLPRDDLREIREDAGAMAQTVHDQLAREVADIETATATLRKEEPALECWTKALLPWSQTETIERCAETYMARWRQPA